MMHPQTMLLSCQGRWVPHEERRLRSVLSLDDPQPLQWRKFSWQCGHKSEPSWMRSTLSMSMAGCGGCKPSFWSLV